MNSEWKGFIWLLGNLAALISFSIFSIIFDWSLWVFEIGIVTLFVACSFTLFVVNDMKRKETWQLFASEKGAELTGRQ